MISDNPLNGDNAPVGLETEVLASLRQGNGKDSIVRTGTIRGREFLISAAPTVAAWTASSGVRPARTSSANSWALSPWAETPLSVPKAIRTPP